MDKEREKKKQVRRKRERKKIIQRGKKKKHDIKGKNWELIYCFCANSTPLAICDLSSGIISSTNFCS